MGIDCHAVKLLDTLSWLLGRLPFAMLDAIGSAFGQCVYWLGGREARVTRRNLELVRPGISARQCDALAAAVLRAVGCNSLHTLRFWARRSEERRVGKEGVSTCISRGSPCL